MARAATKPRKSAAPEQAEAQLAREEELAELGRAFRRVWRSLGSLRGREAQLGAGALSHAQFELLHELYERGELSAGELAGAARMAPGTVTQMLEHLAQCGHVERVRCGHDRRVVLSRLTPQGRERIEVKRAAWREGWEQALEGLDCAQLRAAAEVLARLAAMVESTPAAQPERARENGAAACKKARDPLL